MAGAVKQYDVSRREAAQRLGVHPETIRRWMKSGRLHGERSLNGYVWFNADDIEELRQRVNGVVEVVRP